MRLISRRRSFAKSVDLGRGRNDFRSKHIVES